MSEITGIVRMEREWERRAITNWLQKQAMHETPQISLALRLAARAIERGEHL